MPRIATLLIMLAIAAAVHAPAARSQSTAGKYQLVFVDADRGSELVQWFKTHNGLISLRERCAVHAFDSDDTLFRARYQRSMPRDWTSPALIFADQNSGVIYCVSRRNMPRSADQLYDELKAAYQLSQDAQYGSDIRIRGGPPVYRLRETPKRFPHLRGALDGIATIGEQLEFGSTLWIGLGAIAGLLLANLIVPIRR